MLKTYTKKEMLDAAEKHFLCTEQMQTSITQLCIDISHALEFKECQGLVRQELYSRGRICGILSRGWTVEEFFAFAQHEKLIHSYWHPDFIKYKYISTFEAQRVEDYEQVLIMETLARYDRTRQLKHANYEAWKARHGDKYTKLRKERHQKLREELDAKLNALPEAETNESEDN